MILVKHTKCFLKDYQYLHQKFFDSYHKRYQLIVSGWREIRESQNLDGLEKVHFQTHALKGESGALGFSAMFELINQLDNEIRKVQSSTFTPKAIKDIDQLFNQLIAAHKQKTNPLLIHPESAVESELAEAEITPDKQSFHIALIDDDGSVGKAMTKLLQSFGFKTTYYTSISECKQASSHESFSLVLLDIVMPDVSEKQVFEFAQSCIERDIHVIAISSKDDLATRLMAVRAGVQDYALKPVNMNTLTNKIRKVCGIDIERPYSIVLLDDQETIGEYFKQIAEQKGFQLKSFSDAKSFIRNLDVSIPDVFLLDINMPEISGLEVAKILRHEARFEYVPIVFLSADESQATKLDVLSAGGEDIVSKQDPPEHIFKQLEHRIFS